MVEPRPGATNCVFNLMVQPTQKKECDGGEIRLLWLYLTNTENSKTRSDKKVVLNFWQNVSPIFIENDLSRTRETEFNTKTIWTNIEYVAFTVIFTVPQEMFLEIEYIFSPKFIKKIILFFFHFKLLTNH
jgi:hypothetical protein